MSKTYVDNPVNRKLGRVGMPKGNMPVTKSDNIPAVGRGSDINNPNAHDIKSHKAQSPNVYADNPQNRKLGRVGMPKGSMPVTKSENGADVDRRFDFNSSNAQGVKSQHTESFDVYVDNPQNRKLCRVGMPKGSMPVTKGENGAAVGRRSDFNSPNAHDVKSQHAESSDVYVDNPQNRKLGRVGMPKGSMPVKKGENGAAVGRRSDFNSSNAHGVKSKHAESTDVYVDNPQNRKLGRVGMPKGSMPVTKGENGAALGRRSDFNSPNAHDVKSQHADSLEVYVDNPQNRKLGRVGMPKGSKPVTEGKNYESQVDVDFRGLNKLHLNAFENKIVEKGPAIAKVYKDNPLNRRLGRVGLPIGTFVFSSTAKGIAQKNYEDTTINRKLNRVGKPRGCLPIIKKRSVTEKIPEMLQRIEEDSEFHEYVFDDPKTIQEGLQCGLRDSKGARVEAFDQALCLYNRKEAEESWKGKNATKEAPKTQVDILKDFRGKKISYTEIKLHKVIGKGGFGLVYFAKWQDTVVAVKKIQNEKISNARIKDFATEMMMFCTLDHPNIVKFIGACVETANLCIVMEYMQTTLFNVIHVNDTEFTEEQQTDIIQQVCEGMRYLHSKRIVHCDLKSSNILLDYVKDCIYEVKITDFGLSMIIHDTSVSFEEMVKNIGTPQYSPPEMLRGETLSAKDMMRADVYSLALIFLEVLFREEPFPDYSYQQLKKEVGEKGTTPDIPEIPMVDQEIKDIMIKAWNYEPTQRPSVETICNLMQNKQTLYIN